MTFPYERLWATGHGKMAPLLERLTPWQLLNALGDILPLLGKASGAQYLSVAPDVWVHKSVFIPPDVVLVGPCLIEAEAELRPGAYLRGNVFVDTGAVVGHCSEVKNSVLLPYAALPHFNYAGDSILGAHAHLGAGAVLSNLRHDQANVAVYVDGVMYATGRRKLGALVGDYAEVGCNAVLNPGTVLERGATVHPAQSVKGYIPKVGKAERK